MAQKFRGNETPVIDGKGRLSIPADFRKVIDAEDPEREAGSRPSVVVVYGTASQNFLKVYTMQGIEPIEALIARLPHGTPERKALEHVYHGCSMVLQVLEDGRILVPAKLRDKLGLDKNAYVIARADHFQIWKPETFGVTEEVRIEAWLDAQGADFDPLSMVNPAPAVA